MEVFTPNHTRQINLLKKLVVENNDTAAYYELNIAYLNEDYEGGEYLFYALIMANKCQFLQAYFDVYHELSLLENIDKQEIFDKETRTFMIEYLKNGAALGHEQSKYELGKLYMEGKYLPKDTILGKKLMADYRF